MKSSGPGKRSEKISPRFRWPSISCAGEGNPRFRFEADGDPVAVPDKSDSTISIREHT